MEGFDAIKYNEILGLDEQNLNSTVIAAVGYRDAEDYWSPLAKVRKQKAELFATL